MLDSWVKEKLKLKLKNSLKPNARISVSTRFRKLPVTFLSVQFTYAYLLMRSFLVVPS
jgi:hypothetical protein